MNVLLGDISSYKAICLARFFHQNYSQVNVYTFDSRPFTKIIRTKYSGKHFVLSENKLSNLVEIVKQYGIDLLIPVINSEIPDILKNKHLFGHALNYLGFYETFSLLNDKQSLALLAEKLQIKTPKTYTSIKDARYPCVIKPTNLSSAKGIIYANNLKELEKAVSIYHNRFDIIFQDYVSGIGVGYSVYSVNGEIIVGYGHKRLAEYPVSGGSSLYRQGYIDIRMEEMAQKILRDCRWTGFAMFEFKLTTDNEIFLIEVNPRVWGSINQGLQNGVNYFEPLLGGVANKSKKTKEIHTYLSPLIYWAFIKYALNLNYKPLWSFIKNIRKNKKDVSFLDDPRGYLSMIIRKFQS